MHVEGLKKSLEKKPSKREQDENRIEYELGPEYLEFALRFEKELSSDPNAYLGDPSTYPKSLKSRKEIIWYRTCIQTYGNFFRDYFDERLYADKNSHEEILVSSSFIPFIDKNLKIARYAFTKEEQDYFINEIRSIVRDTVHGADLSDSEEKVMVAETIRDSIDGLVARIGGERFINNPMSK